LHPAPRGLNSKGSACRQEQRDKQDLIAQHKRGLTPSDIPAKLAARQQMQLLGKQSFLDLHEPFDVQVKKTTIPVSELLPMPLPQ
jgi:hypothetical protein